MSALKIIDNPDSDIALVSVLRSKIANFTDNELMEIRLEKKEGSFYNTMCECKEKLQNEDLKKKITEFFEWLESLQEKQEYLGLDELIWYIYESTGYYDFVSSKPNGETKCANLKLLFEKARDYEKASLKGLYNFINYIDRLSKMNSDMGNAKLIGENENVIRIMSIHKSKGLEFPIVFLCGTGKQFNMQDLNETILLGQDIGFGPKLIDYERQIEYDTLAKEAIKVKVKKETISEEMRLLYVALTRAKEKLIITGTEKNLEKTFLDKKEKIKLYENTNKISSKLVESSKSYLDWLEYVFFNSKDINYIELNILKVTDIKNEKEILEEKTKIDYTIDKKMISQIENLLKWEYKYKDLTLMQGKTSVSEISKQSDLNLDLEEKPEIIKENLKLTSSQKGSLMHLILQKIDYNEEYNAEKINDLIDKLVQKEIITLNDAKNIEVDKILKFTKSSLYLELKNAKKVYREKPFHMSVEADKIYKNYNKEKILIQGIIDLYYIDKNDNLVLVDYKTDYINTTEQELIDKYKLQLLIYENALENSLNMKVSKKIIYSVTLGKEILVN